MPMLPFTSLRLSAGARTLSAASAICYPRIDSTTVGRASEPRERGEKSLSPVSFRGPCFAASATDDH